MAPVFNFDRADKKISGYAAYLYYYYYYIFFTPVRNSQGMKKLRYAIQKKYKNQAGMNLTPPAPPSQKSCSKMALYR